MNNKFCWLIFLAANICFSCTQESAPAEDMGGSAYLRRLPFMPNTEIRISQGANKPAGQGYTHEIGSNLAQAIDFSLPIGAGETNCNDRGLPVTAADQGRVIEAVFNQPDAPSSGFGNIVKILYEDGRVGRYAHLRQVFVRGNEYVLQGQVIGTLGNSGNSTGCHLHYDEVDAGSSQTRMLNFFETAGVPTEGRVYASRNTGPYDRVYWDNGGPSMLGEPVEEARWFSAYVACRDDDGNADFTCANESAYRNNVHMLKLAGGLVGRGALVYDPLGGARSAVIIHGQMYDWWLAYAGPGSSLGVPINQEYIDSRGLTRQDGKGGYLTWDGRGVNFHSWQDTAAPGQFPGWNGAMSYLFVEAYKALGNERVAGEPAALFGNPAAVHVWSGTHYLVQDFNYGALDWFVIFYDQENASYGGKNRAIPIAQDFWEYYRSHSGVADFGAPIAQSYPDAATGKERMDFESGLCLLAQSGRVEQGRQSVAPSANYQPNSGQCVVSGGSPPEPEPEPDPEPEPEPEPATEICGDGLDNDEDGEIDEGCAMPDTLMVRFTAPAGWRGNISYYDWSGWTTGGTFRAPWQERCRAVDAATLECALYQTAGTFVEFNIFYGANWSCAGWPAATSGTINVLWNGETRSPATRSNGFGGCNYFLTLE